MQSHPGPLFTPILAVIEAAHFIGRDVGTDAELAFLKDLATGALEPMPVEHDDWARIIELTWRYREMRLGTVDASVVALAERLKVSQIATLDHRHFSAVRPIHVDAFELLP